MVSQYRHNGSATDGVYSNDRKIGCWSIPAALAVLLLLTGCHGGGRLELASLTFKSVDPPAPRISPVKLQECYWWTDDADRVWIAMQTQRSLWFNPKLRLELQMSLVLDKLPAGAARNYELDNQTMRARIRFAAWESRLASLVGIAAVYREGDDRLRVSMRLQATRVTSQILGNWGKPVRYLVLGDITAVHDEQRGRAIAELTESSGWDRKPTSLPVKRSISREHPLDK